MFSFYLFLRSGNFKRRNCEQHQSKFLSVLASTLPIELFQIVLSRISSPSSLRTRSTSTLARGGKHHLKKKILDYITFPFARRLAILSILQIKKKKNEIELLVLSILDQNRISEKEEHFFGTFDSEV